MIPKNVKKALEKSPRMKKCVVDQECSGRIEWNHALFYGGKQLQDWFAIQPLCEKHHRGNNGTIDRYADLACKFYALQMGMVHLKLTYPKRNWEQEYKDVVYQLNRYEKRD